MKRAIMAVLAGVVALGGCAAQERPRAERPPTVPAPAPPEGPDGAGAPEPEKQPSLRPAFPHIRVDRSAGLVEIDGIVPIDAHDPNTPTVYLEATVCTRDSKEHESLVMTDARPSEVHAALLLLGLEPGRPGSWTFDGKEMRPTPPTGAGLDIAIAYRDAGGREVESPVAEWIRNERTGARFTSRDGGAAWVFAGSRFVRRNGREWYDADGAGTLIGLTTFGGETIAWSEVYSPEASVQEPEWIADASRVPPFGTPVIVRIRARR